MLGIKDYKMTDLLALKKDEIARLHATLGDKLEEGTFQFMPRLQSNNWGQYQLVTAQNRRTGKAATYYRWADGHPRSWTKRFSEEFAAGKFA
jgi:hypothetical protein